MKKNAIAWLAALVLICMGSTRAVAQEVTIEPAGQYDWTVYAYAGKTGTAAAGSTNANGKAPALTQALSNWPPGVELQPWVCPDNKTLFYLPAGVSPDQVQPLPCPGSRRLVGLILTGGGPASLDLTHGTVTQLQSGALSQAPSTGAYLTRAFDVRGAYAYSSLLDFQCGLSSSGSSATAGTCRSPSGISSGNLGVGFEPFAASPWGRWRVGFNYNTGGSYNTTFAPTGGVTTPSPTAGYLKVSHRLDFTLGYDWQLLDGIALQPYVGLSNISGSELSPLGGGPTTLCEGTGSMTTCYTTPGTAKSYDLSTTRGIYGLELLDNLTANLFVLAAIEWLDLEDFDLPTSGQLSGYVGIGYRFPH